MIFILMPSVAKFLEPKELHLRVPPTLGRDWAFGWGSLGFRRCV